MISAFITELLLFGPKIILVFFTSQEELDEVCAPATCMLMFNNACVVDCQQGYSNAEVDDGHVSKETTQGGANQRCCGRDEDSKPGHSLPLDVVY